MASAQIIKTCHNILWRVHQNTAPKKTNYLMILCAFVYVCAQVCLGVCACVCVRACVRDPKVNSNYHTNGFE